MNFNYLFRKRFIYLFKKKKFGREEIFVFFFKKKHAMFIIYFFVFFTTSKLILKKIIYEQNFLSRTTSYEFYFKIFNNNFMIFSLKISLINNFLYY